MALLQLLRRLKLEGHRFKHSLSNIAEPCPLLPSEEGCLGKHGALRGWEHAEDSEVSFFGCMQGQGESSGFTTSLSSQQEAPAQA